MNNSGFPLKTVESLTPNDFVKFPIWGFVNSDQAGETMVQPVMKLPIGTAEGRLIGGNAVLQNGDSLCAYVGNYSIENPRWNPHFSTITFWVGDAWFHLSRYHDYDYESNGPKRLQELLSLGYEEIFPITFGLEHVLDRQSPFFEYREPEHRLSQAEIIAMALE